VQGCFIFSDITLGPSKPDKGCLKLSLNLEPCTTLSLFEQVSNKTKWLIVILQQVIYSSL